MNWKIDTHSSHLIIAQKLFDNLDVKIIWNFSTYSFYIYSLNRQMPEFLLNLLKNIQYLNYDYNQGENNCLIFGFFSDKQTTLNNHVENILVIVDDRINKYQKLKAFH